MARLALLTLEERHAYVIDDALAIAELERRGHEVEEVPWRRAADWGAYDGVIIRTTWDYHRALDEFLVTLDGIARSGARLANPLRLVRWNARKTYLRDLAARGVRTVPTAWGEGLDAAAVRALPERLDCAECVLKPVVSANAEDTFRLTAELPLERAVEISDRYARRAWMAQPFVRSILDEGERSLFYFSGLYSHAASKVPTPGDFRVQEEHGGTIAGFEPSADLRYAGEAVLRALDLVPLQARVDLVRLDGGEWALMELELIEPSLYFRTHPAAAAHFADAVERWLAGR